MLGCIAGDIIGSPFEFDNIKTTKFDLFSEKSRFTDDTVLSVALADSILYGDPYEEKLAEYAKMNPKAGYGGMFLSWMVSSKKEPYNSWGNGSAMRVSPIGWAYDNPLIVNIKAMESAAVTHNNVEGIKGAQATAMAVLCARKGYTKPEIQEMIESLFGYDLSESIDSIREWYKFDVSCQGTVPPAIRAFLESENFIESIRLAISIGGDSDTIACITGAIAEAFYKGIPKWIEEEVMKRLSDPLAEVVKAFNEKYVKWE